MNRISNKNRLNKVLNFNIPIFLSLLIHGAFFLYLFLTFRENKIEKKTIINNYLSVTLNRSYSLPPPEKKLLNIKSLNNHEKQKKVKQKNIIKKTDKNALSENEISKKPSINNIIKEEVNIENQEIKSNFIQELPIIIKNPFGFLKLPTSLLGQNFFPRKYEVFIKISKTNTEIMNLDLINLIPLQSKKTFLDETIKKTFANQLKLLSKKQVTDFLRSAYKQTQISTNLALLNEIDTIRLVLEFHEPN
ncbi:hypothetical protein [Fluviispira multicolorata]|uniref:Uncharacterized protein n=1 Tax=Fluviispira multicolorata TaxID=2654512 RepID=A0A833N0Q9_9BACT|nr:hypothetical protein [Fluviispira multicolorata]KAB8029151.1 hypothetical protein GCL57_11475 [Fluviispira multicolorata]